MKQHYGLGKSIFGGLCRLINLSVFLQRYATYLLFSFHSPLIKVVKEEGYLHLKWLLGKAILTFIIEWPDSSELFKNNYVSDRLIQIDVCIWIFLSKNYKNIKLNKIYQLRFIKVNCWLKNGQKFADIWEMAKPYLIVGISASPSWPSKCVL